MSLYTEFLDNHACDFCRESDGGDNFWDGPDAKLCADCLPEYQRMVKEDFKRVTGKV